MVRPNEGLVNISNKWSAITASPPGLKDREDEISNCISEQIPIIDQ